VLFVYSIFSSSILGVVLFFLCEPFLLMLGFVRILYPQVLFLCLVLFFRLCREIRRFSPLDAGEANGRIRFVIRILSPQVESLPPLVAGGVTLIKRSLTPLQLVAFDPPKIRSRKFRSSATMLILDLSSFFSPSRPFSP